MSLLKLILQYCHELSHIETSVKYAADWILLYKQEGSEETPETAVFGLFIIVYANLMVFVILNKLN